MDDRDLAGCNQVQAVGFLALLDQLLPVSNLFVSKLSTSGTRSLALTALRIELVRMQILDHALPAVLGELLSDLGLFGDDRLERILVATSRIVGRQATTLGGARRTRQQRHLAEQRAVTEPGESDHSAVGRLPLHLELSARHDVCLRAAVPSSITMLPGVAVLTSKIRPWL